MVEKQQAPPEKKPLEPPFDKVVSYTVHTAPDHIEHHDKLDEALKSGFRVVDIITTPTNPESPNSPVVITVLLTQKPFASYKGWLKVKTRY